MSIKIVNEVLTKLDSIPGSINLIRGGFLRDLHLNRKPDDIDVLTTIERGLLSEAFPSLHWIEAETRFKLSNLNYKGFLFQFLTVSKEEFFDVLTDVDFTVNSMFYNGSKMFDPLNGKRDIEKKILIPASNFVSHSENSPNAILRTFRFVSEFGFQLSMELKNQLLEAKGNIELADRQRTINEGYRIIKGENVLLAMNYLIELGFIKGTTNFDLNKLPPVNDSIVQRLSMIHYYFGEETISSFIKRFQLSEKILYHTRKNQELIRSKRQDVDDKDLPLTLILKRYLYNDDKQKIIKFLNDK